MGSIVLALLTWRCLSQKLRQAELLFVAVFSHAM